MKRIDLTGIRFNQLVAIKFTGETKIKERTLVYVFTDEIDVGTEFPAIHIN